MCEHHHAAKHILCPQCDMLVALPRLSHGQKAACPRCGATLTTEWDAPRQRPTACALAALFMLLLSNLFPFVNMNVAGVTSEVTLLEIPGVMFSEDYASLGTFFLLFVQLVPAFCLVTILLLVNRASLPLSVKKTLARIFFLLKSWGMAEIFLAGVLVSFVKLMPTAISASAAALFPGAYFVSFNCGRSSVSIAAGCGMISPRSLHWRSVNAGDYRYPAVFAFLRLLYGDPACGESRLSALPYERLCPA